jgi:hypothetical protein
MSALDAGARELLARAGQRIVERFGDDDNVTGVGVGFRRRGGKQTDEPVVTVMVRRKRRPSLVSRRRMIPAVVEVDGTACATDVIQAQAVLLHADGTPPAVPPIKFPTLQFGVGISNLSDARPDAGTLGAFVRDNTDGTTNLLSANHVIADDNTAPIGDPVLNPASLDDSRNVARNWVARLKRFVPIVGGATAVDAAIAEVDAGIALDPGYNGYDNVAAPTTTRPAVGMVVAGDGFGNVWLTRMSTTLTALNATLLPDRANANVEATVPAIDSRLEKIGRTSGYTTGRVFATGQTLDVTVPGQGVVRYTDLILTQWMGWAGDSGAMVIRKGDAAARDDDAWDTLSRANLMRLIGDVFGPCEILSTLEYAYGIPATDDEALADAVRDEYLSQSHVGRFLITLTYLNTALVRSRLANVQSPTDRAYVQALYDEYQPVITDLMTNPSSTRVVTQQDGQTYQDLVTALRQSGVLTTSEWRVAYDLCNTHQAMQGMNRTQVLAYMNTMFALRSLRNAVIAMPAVQMYGAARALSDVG